MAMHMYVAEKTDYQKVMMFCHSATYSSQNHDPMITISIKVVLELRINATKLADLIK